MLLLKKEENYKDEKGSLYWISAMRFRERSASSSDTNKHLREWNRASGIDHFSLASSPSCGCRDQIERYKESYRPLSG